MFRHGQSSKDMDKAYILLSERQQTAKQFVQKWSNLCWKYQNYTSVYEQ